MAKKGGGIRRNRNITLWVRKRKIHHKQKQRSETAEKVFGLLDRKKIAHFTQMLVSYSVWAAYTLACIQYGPETKPSAAGRQKYVRGSLKKRLCHYIITALLSASVLHKLAVSVARFSEEARPSVETLMCMSLFMIQFVGWATSLGLVFRWKESIEMFNSWDPLVSSIDDSGERTPYDDVSSALKCFLCMSIAWGCGAAEMQLSVCSSQICLSAFTQCSKPQDSYLS